MLKIRASYGRAGMSDIYTTSDGVPSVRYPYQGAYTETGGRYNFGTSQSAYTGIYESTVGNRNIKWEISDMVNVGMDFDFGIRNCMDRLIYLKNGVQIYL